MYLFTWERVESHRHLPEKEVARTADGTKIGFCRHCNMIVYWR
jgi:hypothetical protein